MSGAERRRRPASRRTVNLPDPEDGMQGRDPMGRMALYSSVEPEPEAPADRLFLIECSTCLKESTISAFDLAKAMLPFSVHLPFVKRFHSYMRCPACGRRTWMRVSLRTT